MPSCAVRVPGAATSSLAEARPAANAAQWPQTLPLSGAPSSTLLGIDTSSLGSLDVVSAPALSPDGPSVEVRWMRSAAFLPSQPIPSVRVATALALADLQTQVQEDSEPRSAQRRCGPESFGSTDERASCIEDASDGTLTWHREGASCYSRLADIRCAL